MGAVVERRSAPCPGGRWGAPPTGSCSCRHATGGRGGLSAGSERRETPSPRPPSTRPRGSAVPRAGRRVGVAASPRPRGGSGEVPDPSSRSARRKGWRGRGNGTSIPLVSLSLGPAGPEPGPGTRGGPRDGRRKQGRCLRRRSGRGLGVVVSQRGRPGREPLLIANGPSGPFPSGSGVRGPGWVRWGGLPRGSGGVRAPGGGPGRRAAAGRVGFVPARAEVPRRRRGRLARACGLTGPVAGAPLHLTGAGPPSRSSSRPVRWCCTSERVVPHGSTSSFPRGSGVFSRMPVFSGSVPMCRAGPSAHGRISTALNAGAFPHDSTDPPPTGPGRMCSTAPALPMPRTRARPPRPDTADPHPPRTRPPAPSHHSRPSWPLRTPPVPRRAPRTRKCSSNWCFRLRSAHLGEEDKGGGRLPR